MKINKKGLEIIKKYESCRLTAYRDPVGIPTIGWGHTAGVKMGQIITQAQADACLAQDVATAEKAVAKYDGTYHWNENQFSALVSFTYNCGAGNLDKLTAKGTRTIAVISEKMMSYVKAGTGTVLSGLVRRRTDEKFLFDTPVENPQDKPEETVFWDMEAVRSLQEALNADGIRDKNGEVLQVDGIKGKMTTSAVEKILLQAGAFDTSKGRYTVGSTGQVVKWLQMRLDTVIGNDIIDLLGHSLAPDGKPDGKLGVDTRLAIGLFQEMRGLTKDYVAGVKTITELMKM